MLLHERVQKVLEYSGLTIPQFARKAAFTTPQTLRSLLAGNTKTLSFEAGAKIVSAFPELNIDWLRTGEGEMLRSAPAAVRQTNEHGDNIIGHTVTTSDNNTLQQALIEQLRAKDAELQKRSEQIDRLLAIMEHDRGLNHK